MIDFKAGEQLTIGYKWQGDIALLLMNRTHTKITPAATITSLTSSSLFVRLIANIEQAT